MIYGDYLLNVLKDECPFCDIKEEYFIEKSKYFTVLLARAPYAHDHILIVPNRHLVRLSEFTPKEWGNLVLVIERWMKIMESIHREVNLLLRDGKVNGVLGKSIDHLHFHLVPDTQIYASTGGLSRKVYSDYQFLKETELFKSKLKGK